WGGRFRLTSPAWMPYSAGWTQRELRWFDQAIATALKINGGHQPKLRPRAVRHDCSPSRLLVIRKGCLIFADRWEHEQGINAGGEAASGRRRRVAGARRSCGGS